jgi:uncharacterized protein
VSDPNSSIPLPVADDVGGCYWDALHAGRLTYQRCECGHAWLPAREHCPRCLGSIWLRETASGTGRLISWVTYHRAYHPAFKDRLPYTVVIVELDEGPRLISNLTGDTDRRALSIDMPVRLVIEQEGENALPRFTAAAPRDGSRGRERQPDRMEGSS